MKSKDLIKQVLDEYKLSQLNLAAPAAREFLTDKIYDSLSKHYHIFKKNELIVKGDICIYDDWFSTGDLVIKENKISSNDASPVIYFLGRS